MTTHIKVKITSHVVQLTWHGLYIYTAQEPQSISVVVIVWASNLTKYKGYMGQYGFSNCINKVNWPGKKDL